MQQQYFLSESTSARMTNTAEIPQGRRAATSSGAASGSTRNTDARINIQEPGQQQQQQTNNRFIKGKTAFSGRMKAASLTLTLWVNCDCNAIIMRLAAILSLLWVPLCTVDSLNLLLPPTLGSAGLRIARVVEPSDLRLANSSCQKQTNYVKSIQS